MSVMRMVLMMWVAALCVTSATGVAGQEVLNVADPAIHPYADSSLGREGYSLAGAEMNEARLYDFYQRQADYYRAKGAVPSLLPAYPGLDAGQHGHWGLHSKNNDMDPRRNDMEQGSVFAENFTGGDVNQVKAVNLRLGAEGEVGAMFDPTTLSYRAVWVGDGEEANSGGIYYPAKRWGLTSGAIPIGERQMENVELAGWRVDGAWLKPMGMASTRYLGYYRHEKQTVFRYRVGGLEVLEHPQALTWDDQVVFTRTAVFKNHAGKKASQSRLMQLPEGTQAQTARTEGGVVFRVFKKGEQRWIGGVRGEGNTVVVGIDLSDDQCVVVSLGEETKTAKLYSWAGNADQVNGAIKRIIEDDEIADIKAMTLGGAAQWADDITIAGKLGVSDGPYVVDKLPVPFENPYQSMMMLSGIDFFANGDAAVCTLMGDVWRVSGIDDSLEKVTWRRIAAGLHQPFGLKIVDGEIYAMGRDQITLLHDLNDDGEMDYYENFINDYLGLNKSHTHSFGLDRDDDGNWYYIVGEYVCKRMAREDHSTVIARGFRNCMGYGVSDDGILLVAPQEGQWTPASMIIEVQQDEFYGYTRAAGALPKIDPAMCYVPRGIDNSTGGMLFVDSDKWGPYKGEVVVFSYGVGTHYMVLRDTANGRRVQGAVVPLEGEFVSGANRGRFSPIDGQLYVVGTEGWGNYSLEDGCLQRVRYTGEPVYKPVGFEVFYNGIRVDFAEQLDARTAENIDSYLCQQWNYEYAKRYGSPEFSVNEPDKLGHDVVAIQSARLLEGGRSIFLEIPEIKPVMQMYVRMYLKAANGENFTTDLFPTVLNLGAANVFEGMAPLAKGKPTELVLRVEEEDTSGIVANIRGDVEATKKVDRALVLKALGGMKYDLTEMRAKAGEYVSLALVNTDVMPHNVVVTVPGAYEKVGMASFKMLNDPKAGAKHYVPAMDEVIANSVTVNPGGSFTFYFQLPNKAGRYPFLCTFPGHWMMMKGEIVVE